TRGLLRGICGAGAFRDPDSPVPRGPRVAGAAQRRRVGVGAGDTAGGPGPTAAARAFGAVLPGPHAAGRSCALPRWGCTQGAVDRRQPVAGRVEGRPRGHPSAGPLGWAATPGTLGAGDAERSVLHAAAQATRGA